MNIYLQTALFLGLYLLLHLQVTDPTLRKRFALTFLVTGLTLTFLLPYVAVILRMPFLPVFIFLIGLAFFITRNKYRRQRPTRVQTQQIAQQRNAKILRLH